MGVEKGGEACKMSVEPGHKGKPGRERGGVGTVKSLNSGLRVGQSVRNKLGEGGGEEENGCDSVIWIGR